MRFRNIIGCAESVVGVKLSPKVVLKGVFDDLACFPERPSCLGCTFPNLIYRFPVLRCDFPQVCKYPRYTWWPRDEKLCTLKEMQ